MPSLLTPPEDRFSTSYQTSPKAEIIRNEPCAGMGQNTLPILITSFKLNSLLDMPNNPLNLSLNPLLLKIY